LLGTTFLINKSRRPLLGNGSVNTFLWQRLVYENGVVYAGRAEEFKEENWENQGTSLGESVKIRNLAGRWWSVGNGLSAEAEESPLLEDVAGKRLVNTLQAGRDLMRALVICEMWRSAITL
jgi:hypothetical protein